MAKKWIVNGIVFLLMSIVYVLWIITGGGLLRVQAESQASPPPGQEAQIQISIGADLRAIQQQDVSLENVQAAWGVWYERIGNTSGLSPKMTYYQDPQTLAQDFNAGRLDLVTTSPLNYLLIAPQIEPNRDADIYGAIMGGKKTYQYLVLARADAGVADFTNVCGKTGLIQANDPTAAIYLNTLLLKHGQPELHTCFQEVKALPSLSQVVLGVFFKKGVVGITTKSMFETMVDLNPQLGKQLTILAASPELANGIFFFHKQVAPEVKALLLKHILNLKDTSYGQQILVLYKIDGLVPFEPTDLDSMKVLLQEDEQLKP